MPEHERGRTGIAANTAFSEVVGMYDLAPTFLDIAGAPKALLSAFDGRSILKILTGAEQSWGTEFTLQERFAGCKYKDSIDPRDQDNTTAFLKHPDSPEFFWCSYGKDGRKNGTPLYAASYRGLRWIGAGGFNITYAEYCDGGRELYNNTHDPDQLRNIAQDVPQGLLNLLSTTLHAQDLCHGDACLGKPGAPKVCLAISLCKSLQPIPRLLGLT